MMSSNGVLRDAPKHTFRKTWLPWLIVVIPAVYIAGLWAWPDNNLVTASRRFGTQVAIVVGVFLFWAWGVWVSNYRRWFLVAGCLVAGICAVTIKGLECTGDMGIVLRTRFGDKRQQALESHRQAQTEFGPAPAWTPAVDVSLDFPEYRGRNRDGIVTGPPLNRDWATNPPRCLWKQPVGGGYAQFAVAGNAAVTIEQRGDQEAVVCYDTATGIERWRHAYVARFNEAMGGEGPRATPTISGGEVFSLGATGRLVCLDLPTGKLRWSTYILEGNENVRWGMSGSPLVFDNLVVVNPGAQTSSKRGRAVVAVERKSGDIVWTAGDTSAGYSSPMLATLGGHRQLLLFDSVRIAAYDPARGDELWSHPWPTDYGINVAQPLILDGDRVFISAGYGMGCAMLHVSESNGAWAVKVVFQNVKMRCKFTSPVYYDGHIYGLDEGILACIDATTGQQKWRDGRYDHGQLLLSGDLLVVLSERGKLVLVEASPEGHRELGSIAALEGAKTWNPPALAGGRAYVRNADEMACYDLTASNP